MTDQPASQSSEPAVPGPEDQVPVSEPTAPGPEDQSPVSEATPDGAGPSFTDRVTGHAQRVTGHAQRAQDRATTVASERPEVAIGAAFAGGFLLAQILKRLGH